MNIIKSIMDNDLETAKEAILKNLNEKAMTVIQGCKQEVAKSYFATADSEQGTE